MSKQIKNEPSKPEAPTPAPAGAASDEDPVKEGKSNTAEPENQEDMDKPPTEEQTNGEQEVWRKQIIHVLYVEFH